VEAYRNLGAEIDTSNPQCWAVKGNSGVIKIPEKTIDTGNSGTTIRLAAGSASLSDGSKLITLTGDEQIQNRPIAPLLQSLNDLGANCRSTRNNGKPPVEIRGKLRGGRTEIACLTSQYLSSLLLCTPLAEKDTEITVTLLNEPDYVKITCDWLDMQKIEYKNDNLKKIHIKGGQRFSNFDKIIPADFSSATFFACAAAILNSDITIRGLDFSDSQPDKAVFDYLATMGAIIEKGENQVRVKGANLKGIEIDMNATPDALPAMAVTAAFAEGETRLVNVPQARNKETDRIACMAGELAKMGVNISELPDGLVIRKSRLKNAALDGHWDHRIVMALSLAAMAIDEPSEISTAEAMNVTFPNFVELMNSLGAQMEVKQD
jgi:3-phosphoshikimate 1-carboxyvinyltransferase